MVLNAVEYVNIITRVCTFIYITHTYTHIYTHTHTHTCIYVIAGLEDSDERWRDHGRAERCCANVESFYVYTKMCKYSCIQVNDKLLAHRSQQERIVRTNQNQDQQHRAPNRQRYTNRLRMEAVAVLSVVHKCHLHSHIAHGVHQHLAVFTSGWSERRTPSTEISWKPINNLPQRISQVAAEKEGKTGSEGSATWKLWPVNFDLWVRVQYQALHSFHSFHSFHSVWLWKLKIFSTVWFANAGDNSLPTN